MKRLVLFPVVVMCFTVAYAQNDSTRYIFGLPVNEDDTAQQFLERDIEPSEKLTPVSPGALPGKVRRALREGHQYEGWRDTVIYYDANNRLFVVPVRTDKSVRIFGLNAEGHPVTYDEVTPSSEP